MIDNLKLKEIKLSNSLFYAKNIPKLKHLLIKKENPMKLINAIVYNLTTRAEVTATCYTFYNISIKDNKTRKKGKRKKLNKIQCTLKSHTQKMYRKDLPKLKKIIFNSDNTVTTIFIQN